MEDVSQATEGVQKPKEEKETAEKTEEKPEDSKAVEGKEEYKSPIDKAREAAERIEKATEALKIENDRREKIMAEDMLEGRSTAGSAPKEKETDIEYSKRLERGEVNPFAEDAK